LAKKILIIDDEPDICSVVSTFLGKKGYIAVTAKNGKEGVKTAQRLIPDLILLDINMPKMDGYTVLEKLKNNQKTISIPVIILTGRVDDESKEKASWHYCEHYLTKPFDLEELASKIEQVMNTAP